MLKDNIKTAGFMIYILKGKLIYPKAFWINKHKITLLLCFEGCYLKSFKHTETRMNWCGTPKLIIMWNCIKRSLIWVVMESLFVG